MPEDRPILFGPDKNLGAFLMKKTGRQMDLWPGACMVHETFSSQKIIKLKAQHPDAKFIAHPECEDHVLLLADFVGSTSKLLQFVQQRFPEIRSVMQLYETLHPPYAEDESSCVLSEELRSMVDTIYGSFPNWFGRVLSRRDDHVRSEECRSIW